MSSSKEAILLSKMGKKKPLDTVDVIRGENDINSMEAVPKSDPSSIKEMRVSGGNTSLDIIKNNKASGIGSAKRMGFNPLEGSAAKTGESSVPQAEKAYTPINDYLKKKR